MEHQEQTQGNPLENGNGARKKLMFILLGISLAAGAVFGVKWLIHHLNYTSTDDAQVNADMLPLSFKVPGRIAKIYVSEGDQVKKGQKLAELDPTDYRLAVSVAEARLDTARRELDKARAALDLTRSSADIGVAQSSTSLDQVQGSVNIADTQRQINLAQLTTTVERAQINLADAQERLNQAEPVESQARADLARAENLFAGGVVSRENLDQARTAAQVQKGRLAQARQGVADARKLLAQARTNLKSGNIDIMRAGMVRQDQHKAGLALELSQDQRDKQIRIAETTVKSAEAQVRALEAALEQARNALRDTVIVSPSAGTAAKKLCLAAEVVAAGQPVIFVVNRESIWVSANIEEKDLLKFDTGARATVTVDAVPGTTFQGEVMSLGAAANSKFSLIPSSNPTGQYIKVTQRIPVKIRLKGDPDRLKPGMNAVVSIRNR